MTHRLVWGLLVLQLLALLLGTQMPGAWLGSIEHSLHAPFPLSSLAHFVVFAGMGGVLVARPLAWPVGRVVLAALGLALLTEGLAERLLGWRATHTLEDMCADAWRWQSGNPDGYAQG